MRVTLRNNIQKAAPVTLTTVTLTSEEAAACEQIADAFITLQNHAGLLPASTYQHISDAMADLRVSELSELPISERRALAMQQARCLVLSAKLKKIAQTRRAA